MLRPHAFVVALLFVTPLFAWGQNPDQKTTALAHDVLKELIEINTTESVGSTTVAAEAMRRRLLAAGFPAEDTVVVGPEKRGNLVVRYRAKPGSTLRPVLLIGHLDVVEARREDWTTDPFKLVEKDGYFYGRGMQDMKDADTAMVVAFLRLKQEGFVPDRDLILALTAAEEGGEHNGVDWLLKNRRPLVEAAFALNPDAGGVVLDKGRPETMTVEATEKLYADYRVTATNPGGHSSLPRPDNAIYALANALVRLEKAPFPVELNEVTRAYFQEMATIEHGQMAEDMRGVLQTPPNPEAVVRLEKDPEKNAILRTTCVATMLSGGHAPNALPGRATANVNCRIFPGHSQEEIRQELIKRLADPSLTVEYIDDAGHAFKEGSSKRSMAPPPLSPEVMRPLRAVSTLR